MKIILLHFGGIENYSHQFINAILKTDNQVVVFAPESQKTKLTKLCDNKENFCFLKKPRMRSPMNIEYMRSITSLIEFYKPDVVHILEYYPWVAFSIKKLAKYPIVFTVHDPVRHKGDWQSFSIPFTEKKIYMYVSQFIVLGQEIKKQLSIRRNISPGKISVIPHGNSNIYSESSSEIDIEETNFILFFGRIYKYKGLEYLIDAMPEIVKKVPNARLMIAGTGNKFYVKKIKNRIKDQEGIEINDSFIPDAKMKTLFNQASLVVLPYIDATQSGVILMAYAFKKAVISTNVGSLPEYVVDEKSGFIIPTKDTDSIAQKTIQLLQDDNLRKSMGRYGYNLSLEKYSWSKISQESLNLYKQLIS